MTDPTKRPEPLPSAEADSPAAAAASAAAAGPAPDVTPEQNDALIAEVIALREKVLTFDTQIADLTGRLLRAHADLDNLRKRADREKADTAKYAISKFAEDVVSVGDSFQHAIAAVTPDAAEKDPALKSFLDGVVLAERSFLGVLERHGIKQINPTGEPFNPHAHHAAAEEHNASLASGTITKVYQVGYIIEERVLRPAMVVVARGGPKSGAADVSTALDDICDPPEADASPGPDAASG